MAVAVFPVVRMPEEIQTIIAVMPQAWRIVNVRMVFTGTGVSVSAAVRMVELVQAIQVMP